MIKALAVGLSFVLAGHQVASAKPRRAPRRKPPVSAPKSPTSDGKQPTATPAAGPDAAPAPGGSDATPQPGDASPPAAPMPSPSTPAIPAGPDTGLPAGPTGGSSRDRPAPLPRTDEKAGANEALHRSAGYKSVSKADEECALAAFRQGNEQLNNGLFPQAVSHYRQALRCWNHPAIHYNLALALINLDQPIGVYEQLNEAMRYGEAPIGKDKHDHAKEYLKLVAGQLADIEVSCHKPGAKISVDGKHAFVAPGSYKAKVRVGQHTFYGEKQGYNARVTAPFIGPGETFRIELKLYTGPELTRYHHRWDPKWMPYAVLGAGALFGLAGGAFEYSARSSYQEFDAAVARCNTTTVGCAADTPGLLDLRNSGDTKRTIGYVGYGIAGAAVATGLVLVYLNRDRPYQITPDQLEEEKAKAKRPVAVSPIVSPEMTGAMVQGHF